MLTVTNDNSPVEDLFDQEKDTQDFLMRVGRRKTRNKLFFTAGIILLFNVITYSRLLEYMPELWISVLLIPILFIGLAFLAAREPLIAVIIAASILLISYGYTVYQLGGVALASGWIGKAIIITLLISAFQSATASQQAKKELSMM